MMRSILVESGTSKALQRGLGEVLGLIPDPGVTMPIRCSSGRTEKVSVHTKRDGELANVAGLGGTTVEMASCPRCEMWRNPCGSLKLGRQITFDIGSPSSITQNWCCKTPVRRLASSLPGKDRVAAVLGVWWCPKWERQSPRREAPAVPL